MRDWILTLVLAIVLTILAVIALGIERSAGPIGFTFGMCVLIAGVIVRVVVDGVARRRKRMR